jgi:Co/Zn/Cd efflux system component
VNSVGGYTGAILLGLFAALMAWESFERLLNPVAIAFDQALVVAIVGLVVNPHPHSSLEYTRTIIITTVNTITSITMTTTFERRICTLSRMLSLRSRQSSRSSLASTPARSG